MPTPHRVVPYVEPYLPMIAEGSLLCASAHGTEPERADLLAAICLRESWAGFALGYRPKGSPDGSGDWSVRTGRWTRRAGVRVLPDTREAREELRAAGWWIPKRDGVPVPGPYAIPADGHGWGRGLFQIDVLGDLAGLIAPAPWRVERQAAAAAAMVGLARRQLADFAQHPLFERAVIARYNCALDGVVTGLRSVTKERPHGDPDLRTTGGDYSADVEALRAAIRARWPERFPNPRSFA